MLRGIAASLAPVMDEASGDRLNVLIQGSICAGRLLMPDRARFHPRCSNWSFHYQDWAALLKYGSALDDLASGVRAPESEAQRAFAELFLARKREPESYWERLWAKYLYRVEWEKDPENTNAMGPLRALPDSPVGSRSDFEKLHARDSDRVFFSPKRRK